MLSGFTKRRTVSPLDVEHSMFDVRWSSGMRIDIVTLFPEICRAPLSESMMKRAQEKGIIDLHIHNLRDWTTDKHHVVDDAPFGGGQGMVMRPEPFFSAVEDLKRRNRTIATSNIEGNFVVACGPAVRSTTRRATIEGSTSDRHLRTLRRS